MNERLLYTNVLNAERQSAVRAYIKNVHDSQHRRSNKIGVLELPSTGTMAGRRASMRLESCSTPSWWRADRHSRAARQAGRTTRKQEAIADALQGFGEKRLSKR
jgi:hypothetical protein